MQIRQKLSNLFGQIRIYSLVDLLILSIAIKADTYQLAGIIFLHLGFLLFLESTHKHSFRVAFPKYLWTILLIVGIIFYNNIAVIGFLISSFLYTKKNLPKLGWSGPIFRGLQSYFLVAGIIGLLNPLGFFIGALFAIRNIIGDLRDTTKDRKEGLRTLPVIFGLKKDFKHLHLLATLSTTIVWWYISGISILWLAPIFIIQISCYNLTPR